MTKEQGDFERRARNRRARNFVLLCGGWQVNFVIAISLWNDPISSLLLDEMFLTSHMAATEAWDLSRTTPSDLSPLLIHPVTDLMTEMMDMSSDLVGSGIPFLDYRMYAERIFFPGHRESPLRRDLDVQECRRQTVEQGLVQLSNLLNSKLFLTTVVIVTISVMGELKLCRECIHFEKGG